MPKVCLVQAATFLLQEISTKSVNVYLIPIHISLVFIFGGGKVRKGEDGQSYDEMIAIFFLCPFFSLGNNKNKNVYRKHQKIPVTIQYSVLP